MALSTNYAEYSGATFPTEAQVEIDITYKKGWGLPTLTGQLDPGAGGTVPSANDVRLGVAVGQTTGVLDLPAVTDVRSGTVFDNTTKTGSVVIPAVTDVRLGINYDVAPNAKTGSVVIPVATDVREAIAYDVAPNAKTGSVVIPVATDVRETIAYDVAPNAKTGSVVIPTIDKVVLGTNYDVAPQAKTGNVRVPADTDVRLAVAYGPADVDTGNVRVPPVDKVEDGYFYDANDSLEGTLDPGAGGPYPEIVDVRFGTAYGTTQVGSAYIPVASDVRFGTNVDATTGTAYIPVATDVRFGANVDATTGTVVIPAEADVRLGTVYDVAPQAKTGALDVDAEDNHPLEAQVLVGVAYGSTLQYLGTLNPGAIGTPSGIGASIPEASGLTVRLEVYQYGTVIDNQPCTETNGYFEADVTVDNTAVYDCVFTADGRPIASGILYEGKARVGEVAAAKDAPTVEDIWSEVQTDTVWPVDSFGYNLDAQVSLVSTGGIITPIFTNTPDPVQAATLVAYIGESNREFTIYPRDAMNNPIDLTGTPIKIVVEDKFDGDDLLVITDAEITKTADSYTFSTDLTVNNSLSQKTWSTRTEASELLINNGEYVVKNAALED